MKREKPKVFPAGYIRKKLNPETAVRPTAAIARKRQTMQKTQTARQVFILFPFFQKFQANAVKTAKRAGNQKDVCLFDLKLGIKIKSLGRSINGFALF